MSDRLSDAFNFHGRLSFVQHARLERKLMGIGLLPFVALAGLSLTGNLRWAGLPFLLYLPLGVALTAAGARRLHDVGLAASDVWLGNIVALALIGTPAVLAIYADGLPDWLRLILAGTTALMFVAGVVRGLFDRPPEWRRGDAGPNRFGPPPA